jgi:hypothetical protein
MSTLHGNLPPLICLVRKEFLYNQESHFNEYEECIVFGIKSQQSMALTFTIMTKQGVQFTSIPIHALCSKPTEKTPLNHLQPWSCFNVNFSIVQYDFLKNSPCRVSINKKQFYGTYLWTIDWFTNNDLDSGFSEVPEAHKTGHFIQLDNGNFCLMPNNKILWDNPDWVTNPVSDKKEIDYKTNKHKWICE